jgi:hypothetical protein
MNMKKLSFTVTLDFNEPIKDSDAVRDNLLRAIISHAETTGLAPDDAETAFVERAAVRDVKSGAVSEEALASWS